MCLPDGEVLISVSALQINNKPGGPLLEYLNFLLLLSFNYSERENSALVGASQTSNEALFMAA